MFHFMKKPYFSLQFIMKSLLTAAILLATMCTANAQFVENFNDGDFAGWAGTDTDYVVNGASRLQLNGDCAIGGLGYLSYPAATLDAATWTFYVDLDFDPSSANHTRVFLQSNTPVLSGDVYGYFVRIGVDGTADKVELWRSNGASASLVIEGTSPMSVSPTAGIKVVRTTDAEWQLYVDPTGGTDYVLEGTQIDDTYNGGNYFGIWSKYSSTRCDKFYYDDITIDPIYVDNAAPEIISTNVISTTQLEIVFNEQVELSTSENNSNYSVDGGVGNPIDATRNATDFSKVVLTFINDFPEGVNLTLTINNVEDLNGNAASALTTNFSLYTTQLYDVVINEIFADIEPQVALPIAEFIELYNTTNVAIDLTGFVIADATGESEPFNTYILEANGYVILMDDGDIDLFNAYPNKLGVGGFPSLNNDGDDMKLINPDGAIIHNVNYSINWYNNTVKEAGGWTLEMIDPNNPCQEAENWTASNSPTGGTPGTINSVYANNPDETPPALIGVYPLAADTIIATFGEKVLIQNATTGDFSITASNGDVVTITTLIIDEGNSFIIGMVLSVPIAPGIVYTLKVENITDCSGNAINYFNTAKFGLPEPIGPNDVVINEILFNAITDGYDFVEIYNRSNKIIDLSTLIIAEMNLTDTLSVIEFGNVSASGQLFFPGSYLCLSENPDQVSSYYFAIDTGNFLVVKDMPSYTDNEGIVALLDKTLNEIDRFHFYDDYQYALLNDDDGVSLERINFDYTTQDANNWHSAASNVHYATPGYQNSVFGAYTANGNVEVAYPVFSPDGDGYNDILVITYATQTEGFTGNFKIFNAQGKPVKALTNNITLGREGFLTWDGLDDNDEKLPSGIYIVYAELFDLDGTINKYKVKCTMVRKQ